MNSLVEYGKERLEDVLLRDKTKNPEKLCEVLKADIKSVIQNYAEVDREIDVQFTDLEDGFLFNIIVHSNRLKLFGSIPEK